jgi:hypothetical protein
LRRVRLVVDGRRHGQDVGRLVYPGLMTTLARAR